ncbi:bifunctional chorismate mutase/prephenate dehydrogenase [Facilibium subflavum]|uniref:bifunctional chorismate mutase/prephenate dehydrogenase n=1 Tax=Facilibium subflavum TaxID=2219058 RepID=UPI000E659360|nr:bifunctional chorismate mutase/prephenate dehydrogenase [Facilibium subflavum]
MSTITQQKHICIIGGNGAMGQMLYQFLSSLPNYHITCFTEADWQTPQEKLAKQDLVILAVPIAKTIDIINQVSQYITHKTILADITSIKSAPLQAMLKAHTGPVLGLHPIFGPSIAKADKQVIVYCHGRLQHAYQWFIDDLSRLHFILKEMTADAHDLAMTFIQGIEHFTTFCVGLFLKENHIDVDTLLSLSSPVYKMELNIIGRLFHQDPNLYADIIASDKNRLDMIQDYVNLIQEQIQRLQQNNGKADFINTFNEIKQWMGPFTEKAYNDSDKMLGVK